MKKEFQIVLCLFAISCMAVTCKKQSAIVTPANTSLVNTSHLDFLYTPVTFSTGVNVAGVFIYSESPDYHLVADADEGFTCVDDVARATQVYLRSAKFSSDTSIQNKVFKLIRFILEMQSVNGYFYNFLFPNIAINTNGATSVNTANWWSWRALNTLSEAGPVVSIKAGAFLNEPSYTTKGMAEVDNFYPWLLQNGMKSSFAVENSGGEIKLISEKSYEQIAYGIRPMISAAIEAYRLTNQEKYADMAGHFAAWFLGDNDANRIMYSVTTGRCFDGIQSSSNVNLNSGAESTIEALLAMESVESYPAVKTALKSFIKCSNR